MSVRSTAVAGVFLAGTRNGAMAARGLKDFGTTEPRKLAPAAPGTKAA